MVERLGRLSDLELWRDIRASKIEGALLQACTREPTQRQRLAVGALNFLWTIMPLQDHCGFVTPKLVALAPNNPNSPF